MINKCYHLRFDRCFQVVAMVKIRLFGYDAFNNRIHTRANLGEAIMTKVFALEKLDILRLDFSVSAAQPKLEAVFQVQVNDCDLQVSAF